MRLRPPRSRASSVALVAACGLLSAGALGLGATGSAAGLSPVQACARVRNAPCPVDGWHAFRLLSAGTTHTCGVTRGSTSLCWGDGRTGGLGDGARDIRRTPVRVATTVAFHEVRAGDGFTCGRTRAGAVYCWGRSEVVPGFPTPALRPVEVRLARPVRALAAGRRHACVIADDDGVLCWGRNIDGETGNGTSGINASMIPLPRPVAGGLRARSVAAGLDFTCAIAVDGAPWCWGSNVDGILLRRSDERCGDVNPLECSSVPRLVPLQVAFVEITAGNGHACARTREGAVHCWGASLAPAQATTGAGSSIVLSVPGGRPLETIASGGVRACGIVPGGAVYCWGRERAPSEGEADSPERARRVELPGVVAVTVGGHHACALTRRGAAFCWGDHQYGALGRR